MRLFRSHFFVFSLICLPAALSAAGPSISGISHSAPLTRYNKWEVTFSLGTAYANPYDPAEIDAKVTFTGPGGLSFTAVAFPYQAYTRTGNLTSQTLTPSGGLQWKARIAPTLTGAWTVSVSATDATGTSTLAGPGATVQPSAKPGFVRVSGSDSRYFVHDDGSLYVPQGENIAWAGSGRTYQYDQWFGDLAAGGGNFARVWLAAWGMSVDWDYGHSNAWLGNYGNRQAESWELDHVLDQADADGIKVMLCLIHHGMFSSTTNPNWVDNIYSSTHGGPLTAPELVWTNAAAKSLIKRRLRYILARWSYATSVQSWELWNEMEWTDNFNVNVANAAAWHQEMGDYLKANDPHRHLVSTSLADGAAWGSSIWNAGMEYVQTHMYGASDWAQYASDTTASFLAAHPGKPFHLGEWGMSDDAACVAQDPSGMSIGETAWASVMSKASSGGAPWWWDGWVPNQDLYWRWKGISTFLAGEDLDQRAYVPVRPAVSTATRADVGVGPAYGAFSPAAPANSFSLAANGQLSPAASQLGRFLHGTWQAANRNPPTFSVNYAVAGQFKVQVDSVAGSGDNRISILLDGAPSAVNNAVAAVGTYTINVPAGAHTLRVDSTGDDWFTVSQYVFTDYTGILRCYALTGTAKALGWVQSRNYTFWNQCASCQGGAAKALPSISDGVLQLTGLSNDGTWNVSWYETVSGTVQGSGSAVASAGALSLALPAMAKDLAFKLSWAGPASTATFTATPSASRTPTLTASATASGTRTSTRTATPSATATETQAATATVTPSSTESATPSHTATPTLAVTVTLTPSPTVTATDGGTASPTPSATESASAGSSATITGTSTNSPTVTPSPSASATPTASVTATASVSVSDTPSFSASPTPVPTGATDTPTPTPSATPAITPTATVSRTTTLTPSGTPGVPPATATRTPEGNGVDGTLLAVSPAYNPQPGPALGLRLQFKDSVDAVELSIWTPALVLVHRESLTGPFGPGWRNVTSGPVALPLGLAYVQAQAFNKGKPAGSPRLCRLYLLR